MENRFDEFIHEVDEELKWDRIVKHAKDYGAYVIGGILAIILGVSGYIYWNHSKHQQQLSQSDKFAAAINLQVQGKTAEAIDGLKALESSSDTYGMIAKFQRAAILMLKPETKAEAIAVYKEMIEQRNIDRRYRNLAIIFYVEATLDTGDLEELKKLLQESHIGVNMWPNITSELSALVAMRAGDTEQARSILEELVSGKQTSDGVKMRAKALLQSLGGNTQNG